MAWVVRGREITHQGLPATSDWLEHLAVHPQAGDHEVDHDLYASEGQALFAVILSEGEARGSNTEHISSMRKRGLKLAEHGLAYIPKIGAARVEENSNWHLDPFFDDFGGFFLIGDWLNSQDLVRDRGGNHHARRSRSASESCGEERDGNGDHEAAERTGEAGALGRVGRSPGCADRSKWHGAPQCRRR